MDGKSTRSSIAASCAPQGQSKDVVQGPELWPLGRFHHLRASPTSRQLAVIIDAKRSGSGQYRGEEVYAVPAGMQTQPDIARRLRIITVRAACDESRTPRLLFTKEPLPYAQPNSWIASAAVVTQAATQGWVRVWSDRISERYQYEPVAGLPDPGPFPDLDEMIDAVFADKVITSENHPVLQELSGGKAATSQRPLASLELWNDAENDAGDEEVNDEPPY